MYWNGIWIKRGGHGFNRIETLLLTPFQKMQQNIGLQTRLSFSPAIRHKRQPHSSSQILDRMQPHIGIKTPPQTKQTNPGIHNRFAHHQATQPIQVPLHPGPLKSRRNRISYFFGIRIQTFLSITPANPNRGKQRLAPAHLHLAPRECINLRIRRRNQPKTKKRNLLQSLTLSRRS